MQKKKTTVFIAPNENIGSDGIFSKGPPDHCRLVKSIGAEI